MVEWIAFFLIMGIPVVWLIFAGGPADGALQTGAGRPAGWFRVASTELEVRSGPEALEEIHDALGDFWSAHGRVPESVQMAFGIAAAEVFANIVEYAEAKTVRMDVAMSPNHLQVGFTDDGRPVEVDLESVEMPDVFAESGRGLAIAKAALSDLSYERELPSGNRWMLVSKPFEGDQAA